MDIQESSKGAVRVLRPIGPLVGVDADKVRARASQAGAASLGKIVIDASAIPYTDSRGLEVLLELNEELGATGQVLKLVGAGETVREVLDLVSLGSLFEHYEDVNAAVRSFL